MYYKVLKDEKVVDVLKYIFYVKYQEENNILILCEKEEAQGILSSSGRIAWHIDGLYKSPWDDYVYKIVEISKYEYDYLLQEKRGGY